MNLRFYDQVICCSPFFYKNLKIENEKKVLSYHASPEKGFELNKKFDDKYIACSFFGSLFSEIHRERKRLLSFLISKGLHLDIYSSYNGSTKISSIQNKLKKLKLKNNIILDSLSKLEKKITMIKHPYLKNIKSQLFDFEMLNAMSKYICTLNVHTIAAGGFSANMRIFEATSVGTCLITEDFPNLCDLFEPDHEVLTYKSREECFEKIDYCIKNPQKAFEIGYKGYLKAQKIHRYENRLNRLFKIIDKRI